MNLWGEETLSVCFILRYKNMYSFTLVGTNILGPTFLNQCLSSNTFFSVKAWQNKSKIKKYIIFPSLQNPSTVSEISPKLSGEISTIPDGINFTHACFQTKDMINPAQQNATFCQNVNIVYLNDGMWINAVLTLSHVFSTTVVVVACHSCRPTSPQLL